MWYQLVRGDFGSTVCTREKKSRPTIKKGGNKEKNKTKKKKKKGHGNKSILHRGSGENLTGNKTVDEKSRNGRRSPSRPPVAQDLIGSPFSAPKMIFSPSTSFPIFLSSSFLQYVSARASASLGDHAGSSHSHITLRIDKSQPLRHRLGFLRRARSATSTLLFAGLATSGKGRTGTRAINVGHRRGSARRLGADIIKVSFP